MARQARVLLLLLSLAAVLASGCPGPNPPPAQWSIVAERLPEALLSVGGRSSTDVWAVGADKGHGPIVLHYDGTTWQRRDTGVRGHLWWVHVFDDGTAMMGGAGGMIVRWDGTSFTRMETPGLGRHTVFGLWGSSPTNVYAVGGSANRGGFIWHYDGTRWSEETCPRDIPMLTFDVAGDDDPTDVPGLFKVWGDTMGHVWVVGAAGTILERTGDGPFEVVASGASTTTTLFTVSGNDQLVVAVGGGGNGVLLEGAAGTFTDHTPALAGLIQGISVRPSGEAWASGIRGTVFHRADGAWSEVDTGLSFETMIQSLHATWADPSGGVWAVGGGVLSTDLDNGVLIHMGSDVGHYGASPSDVDAGPVDGGSDAGPAPAMCPADAVDPQPTASIARRWNEQILNAIRRDIPKPGVHARNLFGLSAAMWDAWATYDTTADGVYYTDRHTAPDVQAAREEAISYAAFRVLSHRYGPPLSAGAPVSNACFRAFMQTLGYDPDMTDTTGTSPAAIGNAIGQAVIDATVDDGANEAMNYADTTMYMPMNPPLVLDVPGTTVPYPSVWQQLNLSEAATQNGIVLPAGLQPYIGSNWAHVTPFALQRTGLEIVSDLGTEAPHFEDTAMAGHADPDMVDWVVEVIQREAELEVDPSVTINLSPGHYGNNPLGTNDGTGHPTNPVTGAPYADQIVPLGDFGRVLAEFWADGPRSETPPGHWNTLANYVSDHPMHRRCMGGAADYDTCVAGTSPEMDALEWDVKVYLALNGAVHDAAIVAWGIKRETLCSRPITMIRHMAARGQSSDPAMPHYHPEGLPLMPGLIELVTEETSQPGQRHEHLSQFVGEIVVRGWRGEPGNRDSQVGGVTWIRGRDWIPYQRRNFVTPAFPGFTSGHSTFSRSAAEVLTDLTGSEYFPGGLGEYVATAHSYLTFEDGPSVDVHLQWASYFDAADQAGQSRLWGGIHIQPDDFIGRRSGHQVGLWAVAHARTYFDGTAVP
ncbi:MAG: vanadium-dependent haloperoxidase [Sandaracinus sp.]